MDYQEKEARLDIYMMSKKHYYIVKLLEKQSGIESQ